MDFGSYAGYGIPYNVVDGTTPRTMVAFDDDDESDPGPYPIPRPADRGRLGPAPPRGGSGHLPAV